MATVSSTSTVNGSVSTVTNAGKTVDSSKQSSLDKDAFLKLLAAQAKAQDPMNPTDSTAQIAQLAQFSSLEQMMNVAQSTEKSQAVNMIGHTVSYSDATTGAVVSGTVQSVTMTSSGPTLTVNGVAGVTLKSVGNVA